MEHSFSLECIKPQYKLHQRIVCFFVIRLLLMAIDRDYRCRRRVSSCSSGVCSLAELSTERGFATARVESHAGTLASVLEAIVTVTHVVDAGSVTRIMQPLTIKCRHEFHQNIAIEL